MTDAARIPAITWLSQLEAEAIHVLREVAAEFERPVLLFSAGKDSIVLLRLAQKAFRPGRFPFPLLHVDTGHNFDEVIAFRDRVVGELGEELIVAKVQDSIDAGRVVEERGDGGSRNRLQSITLLDALAEHGFDAAIGGARRDEERSRAKERVLSFRDEYGQWDPRAQRPELWSLYNTVVRRGENVRAFPLSNWTELDVWRYIQAEGLVLPSIYFTHERRVFDRGRHVLADSPHIVREPGDSVVRTDHVRYRTVGDLTVTGAILSRAETVADVIDELERAQWTERARTRADDNFSSAALEDRKREGYF
ncbi:MAG: sulfate adenylyltransferase subunit CysD [Solirubrobacteraceae bacterium]|nr:sulfate adenylyltransferase subunit CysD [Patulibacter sp.]